mmetsp:Transcript_12127/g.48673  ORF Transcript_12127/g.48673 Transcript_12127/m.48673 type:complete len:203 (+) Transcript_12127:3131-3739(+)
MRDPSSTRRVRKSAALAQSAGRIAARMETCSWSMYTPPRSTLLEFPPPRFPPAADASSLRFGASAPGASASAVPAAGPLESPRPKRSATSATRSSSASVTYVTRGTERRLSETAYDTSGASDPEATTPSPAHLCTANDRTPRATAREPHRSVPPASNPTSSARESAVVKARATAHGSRRATSGRRAGKHPPPSPSVHVIGVD